MHKICSGLPNLPTEKGSYLKSGGELQPLEELSKKWNHVAIDFVTGIPLYEDKDTILMVIDKATKMCHFITCAKIVSTKDVTRLYWQNVGNYIVSYKLLLATETRDLWASFGQNYSEF